MAENKFSFGKAGNTDILNQEIDRIPIIGIRALGSSIGSVSSVYNRNYRNVPEESGVQNNYIYTGNTVTTIIKDNNDAWDNVANIYPTLVFPNMFMSNSSSPLLNLVTFADENKSWYFDNYNDNDAVNSLLSNLGKNSNWVTRFPIPSSATNPKYVADDGASFNYVVYYCKFAISLSQFAFVSNINISNIKSINGNITFFANDEDGDTSFKNWPVQVFYCNCSDNNGYENVNRQCLLNSKAAQSNAVQTDGTVSSAFTLPINNLDKTQNKIIFEVFMQLPPTVADFNKVNTGNQLVIQFSYADAVVPGNGAYLGIQSQMSSISAQVADLTAQLNLAKQYAQSIMQRDSQLIVGDYWITENNISPANRFGGKWELVSDRFLLGAPNQNYTGIGSQGGSDILTIDQMPAHNHNVIPPIGNNSWIGNRNGQTKLGWENAGKRVTTETVGGNQPHKHPYRYVYLWRKTEDAPLPSIIVDNQSITEINLITGESSTISAPTTGPGYKYQWKQSSDNNTWYDIVGANSRTYSVISDVETTKYYQCAIMQPSMSTNMVLSTVTKFVWTNS